MDTLVSYIQEYCPEVFTEYEVFTEFGRFVHAHNGWVVSDVEYVTAYQEQPIAMVHAGADMFVREIYQPGSPRHTMSVLDANGRLKTTEDRPVHIAGPLCFAGDFLDKDKLLANIEAGDKLVIADAGANAIGMWSRHCSRACPKVIAYSLQRENIQIIKSRETIQDILRFWT
jgi:diaminopimelate decarboxylase